MGYAGHEKKKKRRKRKKKRGVGVWGLVFGLH